MAEMVLNSMSSNSSNISTASICCFTNRSKVNSSAIAYCCASILSILGAGSIIIYSLWKKIVNSPEVQPLFHLAVANLLLAITSVIGVILWFLRNDTPEVDCFYFNCLEETFFVISFFLTVNYGFNVLIRLKERTFQLHDLHFTTVATNDFYRRTFRLLYIFSWVFPVVAIIPLIVKFKSLDTQTKKQTMFCSRCLFLFDHPKLPRDPKENPWTMYNSLMMILTLGLSLLLLIVLYYMTERIYSKTLMHSGYHTNTQRASVKSMRKRIFIFIIIFFLCWSPAFVIACVDLNKAVKYSSTECDRPYIIMALTAPLQGFLNSIVYGWTRKSFRTAASRRRLLADSMQVQDYGSMSDM